MALTSLLWISISLWPARKREDEQGSEEVRRNEYERERKRGEGGLVSRASLGPRGRCRTNRPKDVKHEKKAER